MPKLARLYLDTARLGLMSPSAQLAARDFARLAGEGVSTLYFQRFLLDGFHGREARHRTRLPGLAHWHGIDGLKDSVRTMLRLPSGAPVYLASRTNSLFRQACSVIARRCKKILTTDTLWPAYKNIVEDECHNSGCRITTLGMREDLFCAACTAERATDLLIDAYRSRGCDGILLSSVSHDGIRLPVDVLLPRLRTVCRVELAVIDGAQETAHSPIGLEAAGPDIYLAGCHKWLGAHLPLGICCLARPATSATLDHDFQNAQGFSVASDPLQHFLASLTASIPWTPPTETVNLMPLLSAAGALYDLANRHGTIAESFAQRRANALLVAELAEDCGWSSEIPSPPFRSGILLLKSREPTVRELPASALQDRVDSAHVTLTAYDGGRLRLSIPDRPLNRHQLVKIERALLVADCSAMLLRAGSQHPLPCCARGTVK